MRLPLPHIVHDELVRVPEIVADDYINRAMQKTGIRHVPEGYRAKERLDVAKAFYGGENTCYPGETHFEAIRAGLRLSTVFNFGDMHPTGDDITRAFARVEDGIMCLPFRCVSIIREQKPELGDDGLENRNRIILLTQPTLGDDILIITFHTFNLSSDPRGAFWYPGAGVMVEQKHPNQLRILQFEKSDVENPFFGKPEIPTIDYARGVAAEALGYVSMLERSNLDKIKEPAPMKLNKQRARQGRCPIGTRYAVKVKLGASHAYGGSKGGTHASPAAHWRRAHPRHLSDGRVVPVKECRVGFDDVWSSDRRIYEVSQQKPEAAE
jgi:hypothetical protein